MEKFTIKYDNTDAEIETGYKLFQRKYMLKRNIIFTVVYAIAAGVGLDFMITNYTGLEGYISVHKLIVKLFLQINKIVTMSTQEETEKSRRP